MKKLFLCAAIAVFGLSNIYAQGGFKLGANGALPIGDAGDVSSFSTGVDVAYFFDINEKFIVGPAAGFTNAFGKTETITVGNTNIEFSYDDVQFMPIAGAARFLPTDKFYVGADIGYAIGINDGNDGGFYYRPRAGYSITDLIGVNVSYTGISADGGDWSTIGAGIEFSF
ncbi:outer membrane beta-barrel protein [Hanstruepera flava]|uniref:outer membrane beta-barrel protein n=1 Tax=Hanstruepera flava TaxID=2930218 RepID=UPI002027FD4D|nr:outer membrane beta-barrel protein [Hanstruepera flava]